MIARGRLLPLLFINGPVCCRYGGKKGKSTGAHMILTFFETPLVFVVYLLMVYSTYHSWVEAVSYGGADFLQDTPSKARKPKTSRKPHCNRARQSHVNHLLSHVPDELYLHATISYCIDKHRLAGTHQFPLMIPVNLPMPVPASRILGYRVYPAFDNHPSLPPSLL